jgi:hypothetical protein
MMMNKGNSAVYMVVIKNLPEIFIKVGGVCSGVMGNKLPNLR